MTADRGERGHYFGTEIDAKWWKRYRRDGLFARGSGRFWFGDDAFYFRRFLTKEPIRILYDEIDAVSTGSWHAGQWGGGASVVKIHFLRGGLALSAGFTVSRDKQAASHFVEKLRSLSRPR
jgi:hypothetical protein